MDEIKLNGFETHLYGVGWYTIQVPGDFAANSNKFFFHSNIHIEIPIIACVYHIASIFSYVRTI